MAFLDCYIWEVNKFPRYGSNYDRHTISNVFYHNSETMEKFQNNNVAIQIPEFKLIGTDEQKAFVHKYMKIIIENSIPVIYHKINSSEESWILDLTKVGYLLHRNKKEI